MRILFKYLKFLQVFKNVNHTASRWLSLVTVNASAHFVAKLKHTCPRLISTALTNVRPLNSEKPSHTTLISVQFVWADTETANTREAVSINVNSVIGRGSFSTAKEYVGHVTVWQYRTQMPHSDKFTIEYSPNKIRGKLMVCLKLNDRHAV